MLIKSYAAESAAAALKQVRQEMGGDAIVLKTRRIERPDGTCLMEVTACLEKPTAAQSSTVLAEGNSPLQANEPGLRTQSDAYPALDVSTGQPRTNPILEPRRAVPEIGTGSLARLSSLAERLGRLESTDQPPLQIDRSQPRLESMRHRLREADLPPSVIESVLGALDDSSLTGSDYQSRVVERLSGIISGQIAPAIEINPGDRMVFLGPAGAGKSSVMGKMAAELVVRKKKVKLVTLDDLKIGAPDEIATYADLLQIEVTDASQAFGADPDHVLLIDTPAFPTSTDKIATLRKRIEAVKPTICAVVVSALMRSSDVVRFCSALKGLRPTHVIGTMLDLTSSHGSLLAATETTGRPLLYLSDAPGGMGMLTGPKAEQMAERMLATEETHG